MAILNTYKKIQEELGIIGSSEQIRELVELVMSIAPTNISVLITGESGTGKEVFAKAIHQLSTRRAKDLISVNCGAIPEGILESELFGHEKGSFTGAIAAKKGYFELADGSTILLDEIGEMSLQTQVKLLRVLETGEFMRVGSGALITSDVRVIAATNRDLGKMVRQNHFRKDLYYRLKAVQMHLPPLRERREDILLMLDHFFQESVSRQNIETKGFSESARDLIRGYSWPGNVRELRNLVDTVLVLARGMEITPSMVRDHLAIHEEAVEVSSYLPIPMERSVQDAERELIYKALVSLGIEMKEVKSALLQLSERLNDQYPEGMMFTQVESSNNGSDEIKPLDEVERELIVKALDKYRGNRRKVARALNISERTLYRKIKEYDLIE